jgi:hypothetical protein
MLLLTWWFARKTYPEAYEYRRLAILFVITMTLWIIGNSITWSTIGFEIAGKSIILCLFPFLITISGFLSDNEKQQIQLLVVKLQTRLSLMK